MNGNINNTKDISKHPRKSFLFFLTGYIIYIIIDLTLESIYLAIRLKPWESSIIFVLSGACLIIHENLVK